MTNKTLSQICLLISSQLSQHFLSDEHTDDVYIEESDIGKWKSYYVLKEEVSVIASPLNYFKK
jgi:hypothetical protein